MKALLGTKHNNKNSRTVYIVRLKYRILVYWQVNMLGQSADLTNANLEGANLEGANLKVLR